MNPRLLVAIGVLPSLFLLFVAGFQWVVHWDRPERLVDGEMVLFVYIPLALHVPLFIGAIRLYAWNQGGRLLQVPFAPVLALALFLGFGEALLVTGPFVLGAGLAWWAGRHMTKQGAPMPVLPEA